MGELEPLIWEGSYLIVHDRVVYATFVGAPRNPEFALTTFVGAPRNPEFILTTFVDIRANPEFDQIATP